MDVTLRQQKLAKLLEIEGYDTLDELIEALFIRRGFARNLCSA